MHYLRHPQHQEWVATTETFNRDDNARAAFTLSHGLFADHLFKYGYGIGVRGSVKDGKSAILDFLLFSVMDEKDPFTEPPSNKMYLEKRPSDAGSQTLEQVLPIFNRQANVGFRSVYSLRKNKSYLRKRRKRVLKNGGLFLLSYCESNNPARNDATSLGLSMVIHTHQLDPYCIWRKKWVVSVAPRIRTPQMAEALNNLCHLRPAS